MVTGDYNLALVQINIGKFRVTGFSADDGCVVEKPSEDFQFDLSADGAHGAISRINDNSRTVTLKLRRGSVGYKLVADAYAEQLRQSDQGAIGEVGFSIYDPISGDKISERRLYFMSGPSMAFGKSAPEAEFRLLLPNPTIVYGANIATSA
jgi:hypothetical protein